MSAAYPPVKSARISRWIRIIPRSVPQLSDEWRAFFRVFLAFELCIPLLALAWPFGATALLTPMLHGVGRGYTDDDGPFYFMLLVGIPMGVHAALLCMQRTLWLKGRGRKLFLLVSALFALYITYINSTGGLDWMESPTNRCFYFLAVQALPLLWFAYNLHGESWLRMLARSQRERQIRRDSLAGSATHCS